MTTLCIDIGNTALKWAVFRNNILLHHDRCEDLDLKRLLLAASPFSPDAGMVCSTVDIPGHIKNDILQTPYPILFLNGQTPLPIVNRYLTPDTLGPDRIAAAVGAWQQQPDRNLLIIDSGTAITYDFVSAQGEYLGGNISPGVDMRFRALHQFTAHLPFVDKSGEHPEIGNNTETAIRCGVLDGVKHEITGIIHELSLKYPKLSVFLTGGNIFSFDVSVKKRIFADNYLVLRGLDAILTYINTKNA